MVINILECIEIPADFGISDGKSRLDAVAQLILNRPDVHWYQGRPDPTVKSPDFASSPVIVYAASELGLRAEDDQVDFISLGEDSEDIEMMEALNDGISDLSKRLFDGSEIEGHVYFSPGTLLGKIPRDIPVADLLFSMALFRYVHRTLDRVIIPDSVHPGVEFDVDEFETVLLFLLTVKLDEENVDFDDVSDAVIKSWV